MTTAGLLLQIAIDPTFASNHYFNRRLSCIAVKAAVKSHVSPRLVNDFICLQCSTIDRTDFIDQSLTICSESPPRGRFRPVLHFSCSEDTPLYPPCIETRLYYADHRCSAVGSHWSLLRRHGSTLISRYREEATFTGPRALLISKSRPSWE